MLHNICIYKDICIYIYIHVYPMGISWLLFSTFPSTQLFDNLRELAVSQGIIQPGGGGETTVSSDSKMQYFFWTDLCAEPPMQLWWGYHGHPDLGIFWKQYLGTHGFSLHGKTSCGSQTCVLWSLVILAIPLWQCRWKEHQEIQIWWCLEWRWRFLSMYPITIVKDPWARGRGSLPASWNYFWPLAPILFNNWSKVLMAMLSQLFSKLFFSQTFF